MEHALHLAAKHFVEGVNPTATGKLLNKVKAAMANATSDDEAMDLDKFEWELNGIEEEAESDGADNEDEDEDYDVADTIGKALALVTQVLS